MRYGQTLPFAQAASLNQGASEIVFNAASDEIGDQSPITDRLPKPPLELRLGECKHGLLLS